LGDLARTDVGHLGYVIYNWSGDGKAIGSKPVPFTSDVEAKSRQVVRVNAVAGSPWLNDLQYVKNQFEIDGKVGHDSAIDLPGNSTGSVNINVSDSAIHYVTVISPAYAARRRDFTISVAPQGRGSSPASYRVNEPDNFGENHAFQFVFTGNITLSITNRADAGACLQALFFD
jgi:hypothetical protein